MEIFEIHVEVFAYHAEACQILEIRINLTIMEDRLQSLSYEIRGAAMDVYNYFGPGLLESLYEKAMIVELRNREIPVLSQVPLKVSYKGQIIDA